MISKKYLAVGAAVVLIFLAAIAVFGGGGQKPLISDNKTLTREIAAKMIFEKLDKKIYSNGIVPFAHLQKLSDSDNSKDYFAGSVEIENIDFEALQKAGLIKITERKSQTDIFGLSYKYLRYQFTDKGNEYTLGNEKEKSVALAELDNVEVTGMTELFTSQKKAQYTARYKPTPFGEILGKNNLYKYAPAIERNALFQLYDDGWRASSLSLM